MILERFFSIKDTLCIELLPQQLWSRSCEGWLQNGTGNQNLMVYLEHGLA
jgi:hypothetical protein